MIIGIEIMVTKNAEKRRNHFSKFFSFATMKWHADAMISSSKQLSETGLDWSMIGTSIAVIFFSAMGGNYNKTTNVESLTTL